MQTTSRAPLSATQEANLLRYATLGLGTAVLAGAVTTADASVVYTNFNSTVLADTVTSDANSAEFQLYLASNGTFNIAPGGVAGTGTNVMDFFIRNEGANATGNYTAITAGVNGGTTHPVNFIGTSTTSSGRVFLYPSRLNAGVAVGPGKTFMTVAGTSQALQAGFLASGAGFPSSHWAVKGANSGYLGISFLGTDSLTHYAFVQLTVATNDATNARSVTLAGAGYQTTAATPITTAVPEPTSLALLAVGGLGGIAAFRRRKQAKAAAAV